MAKESNVPQELWDQEAAHYYGVEQADWELDD